MDKIETTIKINATPEKVWEVFIDFAHYPKWSSFIENIEGEPELGSKIKALLRTPGKNKGVVFTPRIIKIDPTKEFRWLGKLGGLNFLFIGEHYFIFEKTEGGTKLIHGERFKGMLVPFLGNLLSKTVIGFENFNNALKTEVESL